MNLSKNEEFYKKFYNTELQKIDKKISSVFKDKNPKTLYEPGAYIMESAGKRLRPFLVTISAKAVSGGKVSAYNAAMAVEMLHNFTLVHDDIMDNADKRRGRPTVHIKYDLSTAILTGDGLIALAYKYLTKDAKANAVKVIDAFTNGLIEVCEGQAMDTDFEERKKVSIDDYKTMIYKKTAALAETCCVIGGIIGGGTQTDINALRKFGKNLGMAFQIQDDLLDIIADEKQLGKPIGGDLVEGKKTFLFLTALELAKGKEKKLLSQMVSNNGIDKKDVGIYREIYVKLGVLEIAQKEVGRYTNLALNSLKTIKHDKSKEILYWLANSLIQRNK